jgi:hypothetical protein
MLEPREPVHSDLALQEMLARALEENALLRRALEEQALPPRARRWVGRTVAGLIVALGLALGALYVTHGQNVQEFRRGFEEGSSGKWLGEGPYAPSRRAATEAAERARAAAAAAAGTPAPPAPVVAPAPPTPPP